MFHANCACHIMLSDTTHVNFTGPEIYNFIIIHNPFVTMVTLCVVIDCNPLANPSNGDVTISNDDEEMELAYYSCLDGFELIGDATRMCTETGLWSGAEPLCEGILIALLIQSV